jgi:hypothetical protein
MFTRSNEIRVAGLRRLCLLFSDQMPEGDKQTGAGRMLVKQTTRMHRGAQLQLTLRGSSHFTAGSK